MTLRKLETFKTPTLSLSTTLIDDTNRVSSLQDADEFATRLFPHLNLKERLRLLGDCRWRRGGGRNSPYFISARKGGIHFLRQTLSSERVVCF